MLEQKEVIKMIAKIDREIARMERKGGNQDEIEYTQARKTVWERILFHLNNDEIITIDEQDRITWHKDAPIA